MSLSIGMTLNAPINTFWLTRCGLVQCQRPAVHLRFKNIIPWCRHAASGGSNILPTLYHVHSLIFSAKPHTQPVISRSHGFPPLTCGASGCFLSRLARITAVSSQFACGVTAIKNKQAEIPLKDFLCMLFADFQSQISKWLPDLCNVYTTCRK